MLNMQLKLNTTCMQDLWFEQWWFWRVPSCGILTLCSPLKSQLTFWRNISLLSSESQNKPSKKRAWKQVARPLTKRWHVPPKCQLTSNRLHTIICQKTQPFTSCIVCGHSYSQEDNLIKIMWNTLLLAANKNIIQGVTASLAITFPRLK